MDGVTPTGSEIKDNYPMVTTSSAGVQTVGHQPHARGWGSPGGRKYARQWLVRALHPKTCLVRVLLLWAWSVAAMRARASELYNSDREFWAVHTDSTCPAQVEKSNLQLECRLWVWSRASARTLICTTALRFRHRTMSKQAVHTNSKCPAQMGNLNIKLECRRAGCTMLRNSIGCPHTLSG